MAAGNARLTSFYVWRGSDNRVIRREDFVTVVGFNNIVFSTPVPVVSGSTYKVGFAAGSGASILYQISPPAFPAPGTVTYQSWLHSSFEDPFTDISDGSTGEAIDPVVCATVSPTAPVVPVQPPELPVAPAWACSTIADVCLRLQQMDLKLDWILRSIPSPLNHSVAEGTIHAGLTGSGTLTVSGILGVRVELTTVPSWLGSKPGAPAIRFEAGRVDWRTGEGWEGRRYLGASPIDVIFDDPTVDQVGYTLQAGVVATITELVQGP